MRLLQRRSHVFLGFAAQLRRCASVPTPPKPSTGSDFTCAAERIAELEAAVAQMAHTVHQLSLRASADDHFVPPQVLRTVVKIFANVSAPHHLLPWQKKLQQGVSGTGFVVDKARRLVMTNVHVVGRATSIQVRRHGAAHRHVAEIVFAAADCDIALLHVNDDTFWADVEEAKFEGTGDGPGGIEGISALGPSDAIPDLQTNVKVVGFPWGGDQVSITSGVVSRVDLTTYGGVDSLLLGIQIDAAINSGNSGGPALVDGKVIGIAFQTLIAAANIGYLIPACVAAVCVRAFTAACLRKAAEKVDSHVANVIEYHQGFPTVGVAFQDMSNPTLRKKYGFVDKSQSGCLIEHVFRNSSAEGYLKPGDVITHCNGYLVGDDATVQWKPDQRVCFSHFVRCTRPGDTFSLTIWRDNKEVHLDIPAKVAHQVVPNHVFNDKFREVLPYCIFGGCVFTELTMGYLLEWGDQEWSNNAPRWLTSKLIPTDDSPDSIVVLSQVLPNSVNRGYNGDIFMNRMVKDVNGVAVKNFDQFLELIAALKNEDDVTISITNGAVAQSLVLPVGAAREADTAVIEAYGIPAKQRRAGGADRKAAP